MKSEVITANGTAQAVVSADGTSNYPMAALILNNGAATVFFGGADVSTSNGFPILTGSIPLSVDVINEDLYAVTAGTSVELRILRRGN
jgi:hypothetical protein